MSQFNNFILAASIVSNVLDEIVASAQKKIKLNQFTRRNQPNFILKSQQNMLNSNLQHLLEKPQPSNSILDAEPRRIPEDNLMNPGICERSVSLHQKQVKVQIKASSSRYPKRSSVKEEYQSKSTKNKKKQSFLSKLTVLFRQTEAQEQNDSYVEALRKVKRDEEQRATKTTNNLIRPKATCKLAQGEQVLFDYQGNFCKRKESFIKEFSQTKLEGNPIKPLAQQNSKHSKSTQSQQNATKIIIESRNRDKTEFSKIRLSQQQEHRQIQLNSVDKAEIIDSFQIKHSGIKLVFDGNPVKKQNSIENNALELNINPKTVMLKKVKQNIVERFKTQNVLQSDIVLPSTKRNQKQVRNRIATQVSESSYPSKSGKISIENHSLHNLVVNQQQDEDNRYLQIPSKLSLSRRIKTNIQKSLSRQSEQLQKLKIKQRLTSLMRQGDRLPQIITKHRQVQAEIFRQLKEKYKQQ